MQGIAQSIDDRIIRSIKARKGALAFSAKDFGHLGSRPAVGQGLARLVKQGRLRRIRQGIYDLPKKHPLLGQTAPDPQAVIRALMDGSGTQWQASGAYAANLLGLSEQVPAKIVILTNGVPRRVPLGKLTLTFRRAAPRNLLGAGQPAGLVIQAIRHLRKNALTPAKIDRLRARIDAETKADLRALVPRLAVWMQPVVRQIVEH